MSFSDYLRHTGGCWSSTRVEDSLIGFHDHPTRELRVTWAEFARLRATKGGTRHYLQTLLCAPGGCALPRPSERLVHFSWRAGLGDDLRRTAAAAGPGLDEIAAAGGLGPLNVAHLFVSDAGARSPLHYDEFGAARDSSARVEA